jgi:hypothetical protein
MNARKKLNATYIFIATGVAGLFGLLFQSVAVFAICLAILTVALIEDGSIRPKRRHR